MDNKYFYPIEGQAILEAGTDLIIKKGTKLTLNKTDDMEVYNIDKLTDNKLVISRESDYSEDSINIQVVA